jgi:hypothetical protein
MSVHTSFPAHIMKSTAKIIAGLALTGLLGACSMHKPVTATAVKPQAKAQANRKIYYIPSPKLPGQWTVEDILQSYRAYATRNLAPYFAKAKVSYPPREVTFIALKQKKNWNYGPGTAASSATFAIITSRPPAAWPAPNCAKATGRCRKAFTALRS